KLQSGTVDGFSVRLLRAVGTDQSAQSFGHPFGETVKYPGVSQRDHASCRVRREVHRACLARRGAGERTILVAEPHSTAVDASVTATCSPTLLHSRGEDRGSCPVKGELLELLRRDVA